MIAFGADPSVSPLSSHLGLHLLAVQEHIHTRVLAPLAGAPSDLQTCYEAVELLRGWAASLGAKLPYVEFAVTIAPEHPTVLQIVPLTMGAVLLLLRPTMPQFALKHHYREHVCFRLGDELVHVHVSPTQKVSLNAEFAPLETD